MLKKFASHALWTAAVAVLLVACGQDSGSNATGSLPGLPNENVVSTNTGTQEQAPPVLPTQYVQGVHYTLAANPSTSSAGPGQVEVIEFFWYGCPHCNVLEPFVTAWRPTLGPEVKYVRVPAPWDDIRLPHAQAYYTAEYLGKADEMHLAFFDELHRNSRNNGLNTQAELRTFFGQFGVSAAAFDAAWNSFDVSTKLRAAEQLANRLRLLSTPMFVVAGKYIIQATTGSGLTNPQMLQVVDYLVAREVAELAL